MHVNRKQAATHEDANLWELEVYIIQGWLHRKEEVDNELAMMDGIMTGKRIIIPFQLQK